MAALSQRKAVLCNLNRFSGRLCLLGSEAGRNAQRNFYKATSYAPKKEVTEIKNGYLRTLISPGLPNMIFIRLASKSSQNSFMADLKSSPPPALFLGFSGALPFCSLATLSFIFPEHMGLIVHAQQAYGACILSFLGAVHWGYTLGKTSELQPNWSTLGYSVTPSLVAWLALLSKSGPGLITLCVGLAFALSKDITTPCFPAWYYALRKALSTLAISSICITAVSLYLH